MVPNKKGSSSEDDYDDLLDENIPDGGQVSPTSSPEGLSAPATIVLMMLASVIAILFVGTVIFVVWQRRRREKKHMYAGRSVLTFSNPNYNASNSDVLAADKRPFLWKKLKYDKAQVSQSSVKEKQVDEQEIPSQLPVKDTTSITSIKSPVQEETLHPVVEDTDDDDINVTESNLKADIYTEINVMSKPI